MVFLLKAVGCVLWDRLIVATEGHSSINMAFEHYGANPVLALHQFRKAHHFPMLCDLIKGHFLRAPRGRTDLWVQFPCGLGTAER
jgi:hypothetical protein